MSSTIATGFALLANDPSLWLAPALPERAVLVPLAIVALILLAGIFPAIAHGRRGHAPAAVSR